MPTLLFAQTFDANSRRTQLAATIGSTEDFVNDFQYDALGRQTRLTQQGGSGGNSVSQKRVDLVYNASGQFDTITRYKNLTATALVASSTYSYDSTGRLVGLSHSKSGGSAVAGYTLAFDSASRITAWGNAQVAAESANVTHDNIGQLTGADRSGTTNDETYNYDAGGNRNSANGSTYTTSANNRLTSDGTFNYTYDDEGNRTRRTKISDGSYTNFTWDHRNRVIAVTDKTSANVETQRVEYAYDVYQRLVGRQVFLSGATTPTESGHFVYDGNQMTLVLDDAGAVKHRYLWGPAVDQIFADEVTTATSGYEKTSWALTDHLNSVHDWLAEETANPGTFSIENHITLDTFGRQTAETNASAVDHLLSFTGRYTDPLTGLQWNLHRWYDSNTGRWLSEDWIHDDLANTERYVKNNPLNATDPTGLFGAFGGLVGGGVPGFSPGSPWNPGGNIGGSGGNKTDVGITVGICGVLGGGLWLGGYFGGGAIAGGGAAAGGEACGTGVTAAQAAATQLARRIAMAEAMETMQIARAKAALEAGNYAAYEVWMEQAAMNAALAASLRVALERLGF